MSEPTTARGTACPAGRRRRRRAAHRRAGVARRRTAPPTGPTAPPYSTRRSRSAGPDVSRAACCSSWPVSRAVSLLLRWVHGDDTTGWTWSSRLRRPSATWSAPASGSRWRSCWAVACCSSLGLLLLVPARSHRFLGVLALLVSLVVVAGVLVPLADATGSSAPSTSASGSPSRSPSLGLLGSLKALLTGRDGGRRAEPASVRDEGAVGAGELHRLDQVERARRSSSKPRQLTSSIDAPAQVGAAQLGPLQPRPVEVGAGEVALPQVGVGEVGLAEPLAGQVERRRGRPRAARCSSSRTRSTSSAAAARRGTASR